MERGGYLIDRKNRTWELTSSGIQLRAANATKPLHRVTADRLLSDLLERIELVNADDHYLARVTKAVVFGSYLSTSSRLGDIDVAVQLTRRGRIWKSTWLPILSEFRNLAEYSQP